MWEPTTYIDTHFAAKYHIIALAEHSDAAAFFYAHDTFLRREVALWLWPCTHDDLTHAPPYREALTLAQLSSPALPHVHDGGFDPHTGLYYVAREWMVGRKLADLLFLPLSQHHLLHIALDMAEALACGHEKRLWHGALSARKLLVMPDAQGSPRVKVLAFGAEVGPETPFTPHQDIHGFGKVMREILAGKPLSTPDEALPRTALPLSPLFAAVLHRCRRLEAEQPFPDACALRDVLRAIERDLPPINPRSVTALSIDAKAESLVIGRYDGSVDIVARESGATLHQLNAQRGAITALAFRPDTREFISAGNDGFMHLWDVTTGQRLKSWPGLRAKQAVIAFSPFGYIFAAGECDGRIRLWSLEEDRPLGELHGHHGPISALHFLPEGRFLASGGEDGTILLWDIGTLELAEKCAWRRGPVTHFTMHVRERFIAAFADGSLALGRWNQAQPLWHRAVHRGKVSRLFEQLGGQGFLSVGLDGVVHFLDTFDGQPRRDPICHLDGIRAAALHQPSEMLFASSDSLVLSWSWDAASAPSLKGYLPEDLGNGWIATPAEQSDGQGNPFL